MLGHLMVNTMQEVYISVYNNIICPLNEESSMYMIVCIRESVDSLCRDGVDTPIYAAVHRKSLHTHKL